MAGPPRHEGPHEEARANRVAATEAVGDVAADGAEDGVNPLELAEHHAPVRVGGDAGDVAHHGVFHRRHHLPVEVVEQRDGKEQRDDEPGGAGGGGGGHEVLGASSPSPFLGGGERAGVRGYVGRRKGSHPSSGLRPPFPLRCGREKARCVALAFIRTLLLNSGSFTSATRR